MTHKLVTLFLLISTVALAAPTPQASPDPGHHAKRKKPLYLPLHEIVPKEHQEKRKHKKKAPEDKSQGAVHSSALVSGETQAASNWGLDRTVDYRKFDTPIITQYRGDCTAQGLAAATENLARRTDPTVDVSQESLWARYRVYSAWSALTAYHNNLIKREYAWPFGWRTWRLPEEKSRYQLIQYTDLEDDFSLAIQALDTGYPLYFARSVSRGEAGCLKVTPSTGINAQPTQGGHATSIVGYRVIGGDLQFLIKQQWGTDCGDHGYQWISSATCTQPGAYCNFWKIESLVDKTAQKTYQLTASKPVSPTTPVKQ